MLQGSTVVKNEVVGNVKELGVGELDVSTNYTLEVYAKNVAGEGSPGTKNVTTKYEGMRQCSL